MNTSLKAVDPDNIAIVKTDWSVDGSYRTEFTYLGRTGFIVGAWTIVDDRSEELFDAWIRRKIADQIDIDPFLGSYVKT